MSNVLAKIGVPAFSPLPLLSNNRIQTVAARYLPAFSLANDDVEHIITLSSGDKIIVVENRPRYIRPSSRVVLLVHGLAGSHESPYMKRIATQLIKKGYVVLRMNLRGCGPGKGKALGFSHAGRSDDTRAVLEWALARFPSSPLTQVGFSLGANITLKMAGEDGGSPTGNLDSIIAVSPPLDLHACVKLLIARENWIFNYYFMRGLLKAAANRHEAFPDLVRPLSKKNIKDVLQFDEHYTAPLSGFKNAIDYYERCSSKQFLKHISLPSFILHALDDPFISQHDFLSLPPKANFDVVLTKQGGHVGWLGSTKERYSYSWMDTAIVAWIQWFDKRIL